MIALNGRRSSRLVIALVAALACLACVWAAGAQARDFEIPTFVAPGVSKDQSPSTGAGARPFELVNNFAVSQTPTPEELFNGGHVGPSGNVKDIEFRQPPGIVGNAAAYPQCTQEQFNSGTCSLASQVGVASVILTAHQASGVTPVFNMVPPPGVPAQFAFRVILSNVHINFHVRSGTDYGVTASLHGLSEALGILTSSVTIWGVPGDPAHDALRMGANGIAQPGPYPEPPPYRPLLSNPTSCGEPLVTTMEATTWQHPDQVTEAAPFEAPAMSGCDQVDFSPTIEAKPTTNLADSPTGFEFHLHIPQNEDSDGNAEAELRQSKIILPPGLTINPSSANGLAACTPGQIGYTGRSNERQLLRYDLPPLTVSGSFVVEYGGQSTAPISATAKRDEVAAAIETLPGLAGNIEVSGAPGGWIVTFVGALAATDVPRMSGTVTDLPAQSVAVTGEGGSFTLQLGAASTDATMESSFGPASSSIFLSNPSRKLAVGEVVSGPGIAAGTTIAGFPFGAGVPFISLSSPTTSEQTGAHLSAALAFDTSPDAIQEALAAIPAITRENLFPGNVFVAAGEVKKSTRFYKVTFAGELAGTEPALTATSSLTGPGAGVAIAPQPPAAPKVLSVARFGGVAPGTPQFTEAPADCPPASKVGTVRIDSPTVVDHPLEGEVFLASSRDNPFDSVLALYIVVEDPASGIVLKLPLKLEGDPQSGQLTATLSEAPQLPFEDLRLEFFKGAAAPLKTGIACGSFAVKSELTPWTAPEAQVAAPEDTFKIENGAGAGPCVNDEASAPNAPRVEAGTFEPTAGLYSPFTLKLVRADGTQQMTGVDAALPKGLLAKLAGVPYCSDGALARAAASTGRAELASPSCPAASRVGDVHIGAGAGPTPFYTSGSVYLAGPYKGAPLSLAVVTPAVAGPFDLGTVVVRNALQIDPETAQVHTVSDPIPTVLEGIPVDLRSVVVNLDRGQFTKNPTSCNPLSISGFVTSLSGQRAPYSQHFQVGDCNRLAFKPKLALLLRGDTSHTGHPALRATLTAREGDSNIGRVSVALPKSEFLDNSHIKTICTRVQFAAHACPPASVYGRAKAITPLLDAPLQGPVYLRSSSNKLPDLVADLGGQINVVLDGRIDSGKSGGIRTTFESVPDAPVSSFVLEMEGGRKGLLENSVNLCSGGHRATVLIDGQNGKSAGQRPPVTTSCKKSGKRAKRSGRRARG